MEIETRAMVWGLSGLSGGSVRHAFIDRRMGHMDIAYKGLSKLVGEEQATLIAGEVWEQLTQEPAH